MKILAILILSLASESLLARTLCLAHRGGGWESFDNSISAIKSSIEKNFDGIEVDLHSTSDETVILLHDDTLANVATGAACPLSIPIKLLDFKSLSEKCKLKNEE